MFIDVHLHSLVNVAYRLHGGVGVTDVEILRNFELRMPNVESKTRSVDEHAAEVLSRYSVFDLREVSRDEIDRATARLERGTGFIGIVRSGTRNMIAWFEVASGDNAYEARRFETFWFCSCPGFTFSKTCCKHIAFIHSQQTRKVKYGNRQQTAQRQRSEKEQTSTALEQVKHTGHLAKPAQLSLGEIRELGDIFFASGMFQDVKNVAQAMVKIKAGEELRIYAVRLDGRCACHPGQAELGCDAAGVAAQRLAAVPVRDES
jgi:hypothetical protein